MKNIEAKEFTIEISDDILLKVRQQSRPDDDWTRVILVVRGATEAVEISEGATEEVLQELIDKTINEYNKILQDEINLLSAWQKNSDKTSQQTHKNNNYSYISLVPQAISNTTTISLSMYLPETNTIRFSYQYGWFTTEYIKETNPEQTKSLWKEVTIHILKLIKLKELNSLMVYK